MFLQVMKDFELDRTRCYNVADLLDHFLQCGSAYYELKLVDFGNGIYTSYTKKSKYNQSVKLSQDQISEVCRVSGVYMVESEKDKDTYYQVDMRFV